MGLVRVAAGCRRLLSACLSKGCERRRCCGEREGRTPKGFMGLTRVRIGRRRQLSACPSVKDAVGVVSPACVAGERWALGGRRELAVRDLLEVLLAVFGVYSVVDTSRYARPDGSGWVFGPRSGGLATSPGTATTARRSTR